MQIINKQIKELKMYMNDILRSMQMTTAQELREIVKNG